MKLGMVAERGLRISRAYIIDGLYNGGVGLCDVMIDESDHPFLQTMGETELNNNEKFVCCFASFLTEAMSNSEYKKKEE